MKKYSGTCNKVNTSLLVTISSQHRGFPTSANKHLDLWLHQEPKQINNIDNQLDPTVTVN